MKKINFSLQFSLIFGILFPIVLAGGPTIDPSPNTKAQPRTIPCPYFCLNPFKKLFPNPNHTPSFNGCGSGGLKIDKKDLPVPGIETCCNQHDICYDTCKNGKIGCDNVFRSCMMNACGQGFSAKVLACKAYAEGLYLAVDNFGCPAYLSAQSNACVCKYR